MKKITPVLAVLLAVLLCGTALAADLPEVQDAAAVIAEEAGVKPGELLKDAELFPAGSSVNDWLAMAFALGGANESYDAYLDGLRGYVTGCYAQQGCLHTVKATEYHRIALTVLALGGDPTGFGERPDGSPVDLVADGVWYFEKLGMQGLNGKIFALILADAGNYAAPADSLFTREGLVSDILAAQEPDGGFGLSGGSSDADITAMALQALAPYEEQCGPAIQSALDYLAGCMTDTCGFVAYGEENAETAAQTVIALCALGIDPQTDERFIRGERTLLDELDSFRTGAFYSHELNGDANLMATEQVLLARIAVERLRTDGTRLYDFTAGSAPETPPTPESAPAPVQPAVYIAAGALLLLLAAAAVLVIRRKKHAEHHG